MTIALALVITGCVAAAAVLLMLALRRRSTEGGLFGLPATSHPESRDIRWIAWNGFPGAALGIIGTVFAIMTSFVLLLTLQDYSDARKTAISEARAATNLYLLSDVIRGDIGRELRGADICYARAVVVDEWPQLDDAEESPVAAHWGISMAKTLPHATVSSPKQSANYSAWLDAEERREEARFNRLDDARALIPPLLWIALIGTGALVIVGT